jgi:hypothetical protein
VEKVSILPYHEWGRPKYGFLDREYPFEGRVQEDQDRLEAIRGVIESEGLTVTVDY